MRFSWDAEGCGHCRAVLTFVCEGCRIGLVVSIFKKKDMHAVFNTLWMILSSPLLIFRLLHAVIGAFCHINFSRPVIFAWTSLFLSLSLDVSACPLLGLALRFSYFSILRASISLHRDLYFNDYRLESAQFKSNFNQMFRIRLVTETLEKLTSIKPFIRG